MALALQSAQDAVTATLNLGVALAAGAALSAGWLAGQPSAWAASRMLRLRAAALGGAIVAIAASAVLLWLEAAAMAEVPLANAGPAVVSVLSATHYGLAWMIGIAALTAAALAAALFAKRLARAILMLALAVFLYTRSMVSHAAGDGDLSWAMASDWLHLVLISLWVGAVLVAGWISLPQPDGGRDRARYIESLSASATLALAGIVATGLFAAWRNVGSIDRLSGNPYGDTLLLKLALVALAAALGALNRFVFMPPLLAGLNDGKPAPCVPARCFLLILRVEGLALAGVLLLAAMLGASAPPTAG
jgi:putative copper resistance protein D